MSYRRHVSMEAQITKTLDRGKYHPEVRQLGRVMSRCRARSWVLLPR